MQFNDAWICCCRQRLPVGQAVIGTGEQCSGQLPAGFSGSSSAQASCCKACNACCSRYDVHQEAPSWWPGSRPWSCKWPPTATSTSLCRGPKAACCRGCPADCGCSRDRAWSVHLAQPASHGCWPGLPWLDIPSAPLHSPFVGSSLNVGSLGPHFQISGVSCERQPAYAQPALGWSALWSMFERLAEPTSWIPC